MSQQPPQKAPENPAQKPAGAATAPREERFETSERNKFVPASRPQFTPTPLKKPPPPNATGNSTGEFAAMRPPTTPRAPRNAVPAAKEGAAATPTNNAFLMPGAGAPIVDEPRQPAGRPAARPAQKPAEKPPEPAKPQTAAGAQPQRTPSNPRNPPPRQPGQQNTTGSMPKPAAAAPAKGPAPKAAGLITSGDVLGYQGKLPVYVGKASDGNPMVDAEDARFTFDPKGGRVQLECKVASIMMKAACLHLGLPTPERGPRRFSVVAQMRPEVIQKHHAKIFDGNLEVRLGAQEEGRPVLLDLTVYQNITLTPDG